MQLRPALALIELSVCRAVKAILQMSNTLKENIALSNLRLMMPSLRYRIRGFLSQYPSLYLPVVRRLPNHNAVIAQDTKLLIEGFPRSANTFAVAAFKLVQSQDVKVAHHLHAAAHVIKAARRQIPALVLIRYPEEAVLSHVIYEGYITVRQGLREYVRFYECIRPYRRQFVVATFGEVINDFGAVIRKINRRFQTHFDEFYHTAENLAKCHATVENYLGQNRSYPFELRVPRPSGKRNRLKDKLRSAFNEPSLQESLNKANRIYEVFKSYVESPS
jgi:hypothetical protein